MIKAIAIDDEKNALGIIKEYAKDFPQLQLLKCFTNPHEGLTYLQGQRNINLVFLDIQMSSLNGMTFISQLDHPANIVFTTAHPEYAIEGYELDVLDYLLKPFSKERFARAIQKYELRNHARETAPQETLSTPKLIPCGDDFIFVKTDYKYVKIRLDELRIIEGAGNYVSLQTERGKILTLQNMRAFEEYLQPYFFVRVHKSFIVSARHIDAIEHNHLMIGSKRVPIGESYRAGLHHFISQFARLF